MPDIGSTLREARMRARIDITEVEARTKIRAKYLRAIENEEWDLLPGPIYVKSFLRTYGDYLGLDSRLLIDEFKRRYEGPADHELRPISSLRRERERERERERAGRGFRLPTGAIIGLILIGVVAVLWLIGRGSSNPNKTAPAGAGASARHPAHRRTAGTQTTTAARVPAARPRTVKLQLVPTAPVYVCVVNQAGTKLIPGVTYAVGQTVPVVRSRELLVTLGNNGVEMRVNGRLVAVAPSSGAIGLKVTPLGVRPLPAAQDPTCA
jgi:cytoskeleton protein RodZ